MNYCSDDDVAYESKECPACRLDALLDENRELRDRVESLEDDIRSREEAKAS